MQLRVLLLGLIAVGGVALAQTQKPPHPLTHSPPPQPPIVLNPLPPTETVDLRSGEKEPMKVCTREVFVPCPDERGRNCTRKETYRCN
jgi:hypothetical protein